MIEFSWISMEQLDSVYYPALSNEYPYLCFDDDKEQQGKSKFLEDPLYEKLDWYVASSNGVDCGIIATKRENNILYVKFFEVGRSFQGCGLGTRIIEELQEQCRQNLDIDEIRLIPRDNGVEEFYFNLGFEVIESDCFELSYRTKI